MFPVKKKVLLNSNKGLVLVAYSPKHSSETSISVEEEKFFNSSATTCNYQLPVNIPLYLLQCSRKPKPRKADILWVNTSIMTL